MAKTLHITLLHLICLLLVFTSCSRMREAQSVLCEADSLRSEGIAYPDSARLANAYSAPDNLCGRLFRPDDYVRACYRYGKQVLRQNDYPAAMQTFIDATRAQYILKPVSNPFFTDHVTLGRIYSNMGEICHLEGNFSLSYDMFEECAKQFMTAGDTTMYYYALYSMALELAEQKKADSTQLLLRQIEENTSDPYTISLVNMTRARLNLNLQQYDTALFYANQSIKLHSQEPGYYVIKAQAFEFLHQYDSALLYASYVMSLPTASAQERRNMLYILTYYDEEIDDDEIKRRSEERDDINRYVLTPLRHKLTQAVDLLKQEMDSNPNYANIVFWVFSLCLIGGIAWISKVKHKRRLMHLQKETVLIQEKTAVLQKEQKTIITANNKMTEENISLKQQHELLMKSRLRQIEENSRTLNLSKNLFKDLHWKNTDELYETVNYMFFQFVNKLKAYNTLNEKDIRLCILVLIGGRSDKELSEILCYSEKSIRGMKRYVASKLGTTSGNLNDFLVKKAAGISEIERRK